MKHYMTRAGLAALAFAGIICASYNNPKECKGNYFTKEEIDAIYDATFRVDTIVTLEQKVDDDEDFEKSWFGSGTLMIDSQTGDNYIFTAEHVTADTTYTSKKTKRTTKVITEKIVVEGQNASVFKEDEENDLALLKLSFPLTGIGGRPSKPFIGEIAQYLNPNDYIIGVGFPEGNKKYFSTTVGKITEDKMYLDIHMIGGNSGGGMYLINRNYLQLCSVVTEFHNGPSLKKVREFFKGTPLEDDYLK